MIQLQTYKQIITELENYNCNLVAVSKLKPVSDILGFYQAGHRIFGENYVNELVEKQSQLPEDINWHFIGHLQSNKVKYIAPFVSMIHSVDSLKLLKEINKRALQNDRIIDCLVQIHIAEESTKFGFSANELLDFFKQPDFIEMKNICIKGVMGMGTFTNDQEQIKKEFSTLLTCYEDIAASNLIDVKHFTEKSFGMSGDYKIALKMGSSLIRIGSLLFGSR